MRMGKTTAVGPPGRGRATILDVARAAAVSRQTVSNALNYPERLQPDTLQRVQMEIHRLGYRPSQAARSLRNQRAGAVGVEVAPLDDLRPNDVAYPFLAELSLAAPAHACHMVTFGSRGDTDSLLPYQDMLTRRLVDAFVIADTHSDDPRPTWLTARGIPFAAFGRVWDDPSVTSWSDVDGSAGCEEAVRHLIGQGYGRPRGARIAFLGWPAGSPVGDDRRAGWQLGLARAGLEPGATASCEQDLDSAIGAATLLVRDLAPGSAVVCASDLLALGVWHAATARGLRVGPDLGVVGFDNSRAAETYHLTTLAQPLREIADHLLDVVHHQLDSGSPAPEGVLMLPHLVARSSTNRATA